jgi:hypothetical protein
MKEFRKNILEFAEAFNGEKNIQVINDTENYKLIISADNQYGYEPAHKLLTELKIDSLKNGFIFLTCFLPDIEIERTISKNEKMKIFKKHFYGYKVTNGNIKTLSKIEIEDIYNRTNYIEKELGYYFRIKNLTNKK